MRSTLALLSLLSPLASALPPPVHLGYKLLWSDAFAGSAGETPNTANWNLITEYVFANTPPPTFFFPLTTP